MGLRDYDNYDDPDPDGPWALVLFFLLAVILGLAWAATSMVLRL